MKVKKLIEMLQEYDEDQEVYLAYPSGDYWRTVVAVPVMDAEEAELKMSDYHGTMQVMSYDEESGLGPDEMTPVVLSSGRLLR